MVRVCFDIAVYDQEAAAGQGEAAAGASNEPVVKSRQVYMTRMDQQHVRVMACEGLCNTCI